MKSLVRRGKDDEIAGKTFLDHPKEAFTTLEGEKDVFALFE